MRTWKELGLACSVAVMLGSGGLGSSVSRADGPAPPPGGDPVAPGTSTSKSSPSTSTSKSSSGPVLPRIKKCGSLKPQDWPAVKLATGGASPASTVQASTPDLVDHCQPPLCGLNGIWLGEGVQFRTLHLDTGRFNESGLTITSFQQGQTPLTLHVDQNSDILYGTTMDPSSRTLTGHDLIGATITLGRGAPFIATKIPVTTFKYQVQDAFRITIVDYHAIDPWAQCTDCRRSVPTYTFFAENLEQKCEVELCKPGLAQEFPGSLKGTAVIFRGDYYDDQSYKVDDSISYRQSPDWASRSDLFNIACLGTATSKLHMLRHTAASMAPSPPYPPLPNPLRPRSEPPSTLAQRQTLLRLLTADYCGTGTPHTLDGTPIRFKLPSMGRIQVTPSSGYPQHGDETIEAAWKSTGASCLSQMRHAERYPNGPECRIDACPPGPEAKAIDTSFSTGAYAISLLPPRFPQP